MNTRVVSVYTMLTYGTNNGRSAEVVDSGSKNWDAGVCICRLIRYVASLPRRRRWERGVGELDQIWKFACDV